MAKNTPDETPAVVEEATEVVEEHTTDNAPVPVPEPLADKGDLGNRVGILEGLVSALADKISALTTGDVGEVIDPDDSPAAKPWTHKGFLR